LSHVAAGVICSQLVPAPSRGWAAAAGVLFALLPDIDYFFILWDRLAFIRYHRGFTHSLAAVPVFALAGGALGRVLGGDRWFKPLLLIGLAVLASHLLLDLATSYGTQILSPFSRRRFSLDWIFILDPYFTALLVAGAICSLAFPVWGRRLGAGWLAAAMGYLLVCALYHHQALALGHRLFQAPAAREQTVAALPQPFSCRRWQLLAAGPGQIRQAFVQLPYGSAWGLEAGEGQEPAPAAPESSRCDAPPLPYQDPARLTLRTWTPAAPASRAYPPEAAAVLADFLEFARFPLLCRVQSEGGEQILEWLDLRFSIPGRPVPFVLELRLDAQGRLQQWLLGRRKAGGS
jgi:inner membrane protein